MLDLDKNGHLWYNVYVMPGKKTNAASVRTRRKIREQFARLLKKYKNLSKINVTELVENVGISRSTFYTHYQSLEEVAREIKNEIANTFFEQHQIKSLDDMEEALNAIYRYLKKNDRFFKLVFKADKTADFALVLGARVAEEFTTLLKKQPNVANRKLLGLEFQAFMDGQSLQYIRYYRGETQYTLEDILACGQLTLSEIIKRQC